MVFLDGELRKAGHSAQHEMPGLRLRLEGSERPELFFPVELLEALVRNGISDPDYGQYRQLVGSRVELPDEFWPTLEATVGHYTSLIDQVRDFAQANPSDYEHSQKALSRELCGSREASLRRAYAVFGKDEFEGILYIGVAPDLNTLIVGESREEIIRSERALAAGCP
jgi:hypothetical protein